MMKLNYDLYLSLKGVEPLLTSRLQRPQRSCLTPMLLYFWGWYIAHKMETSFIPKLETLLFIMAFVAGRGFWAIIYHLYANNSLSSYLYPKLDLIRLNSLSANAGHTNLVIHINIQMLNFYFLIIFTVFLEILQS